MVSVMTIMGVVLSLLYISNYRNQIADTKAMMQNELTREIYNRGDNHPRIERTQGPDSKQGYSVNAGAIRNFLPSVFFKLDANETIIEKKERVMTIDDETAKDLVQDALAKHKGHIMHVDTDAGKSDIQSKIYHSENGLEYSIVATKDYTYILFIDNGFALNDLRRLLMVCILIFCFSFLVFFAFSIFLSNWALKPVENAWKQQSQFIGDASHELRTPITVILANLDILLGKKGEQIDENIKWIHQSKSEANRMKTLIEDLLYLARAESGKTMMEMKAMNISDCLTERVLNLEVLAFEKGIEIEEHIQESLFAHANENAMKQLFTILLDNAMKYCDSQKKIKISAYQKEHLTIVKIFNTSPPLSSEECRHIFDRFYRVDASRQRKDGGYGLGLAIAGNIASMHQAKLYVANEANGVSFVLELKNKHEK